MTTSNQSSLQNQVILVNEECTVAARVRSECSPAQVSRPPVDLDKNVATALPSLVTSLHFSTSCPSDPIFIMGKPFLSMEDAKAAFNLFCCVYGIGNFLLSLLPGAKSKNTDSCSFSA
jgi:hypothetical protein